MEADAALVLDDVSKRFGDARVVDALSFRVRPGEVFGFLGGNGAGKTTSLRMVLDILRPTSGRITVLGRSPGRANGPLLGFLPEERGLHRTMRALETISYFGQLKGLGRREARLRGQALLDRFGIGSSAHDRVERLSKGMAQKVQLASAIVNRPRLVLLDEPFSGLDPVNQGLLEREIRALTDDGAAVLFSTHVMQHAERLCDRVLLLARGRKLFEGTPEEARATLPARLTIVSERSPLALAGVAAATPSATAADGWAEWEVRLAPGIDPAAVLEACSRTGFALRRFEHRRETLHDAFLHIVGGAAA